MACGFLTTIYEFLTLVTFACVPCGLVTEPLRHVLELLADDRECSLTEG